LAAIAFRVVEEFNCNRFQEGHFRRRRWQKNSLVWKRARWI